MNTKTGLRKTEASHLKAKIETKVEEWVRDSAARLILGHGRENRELRQRGRRRQRKRHPKSEFALIHTASLLFQLFY